MAGLDKIHRSRGLNNTTFPQNSAEAPYGREKWGDFQKLQDCTLLTRKPLWINETISNFESMKENTLKLRWCCLTFNMYNYNRVESSVLCPAECRSIVVIFADCGWDSSVFTLTSLQENYQPQTKPGGTLTQHKARLAGDTGIHKSLSFFKKKGFSIVANIWN